MSREFMTDWLVRRLPSKDHNEHLNALAKLPAQFVFDLLIFPLLEAQLECFVSGQTLTVQPLFAFVLCSSFFFFSFVLYRSCAEPHLTRTPKLPSVAISLVTRWASNRMGTAMTKCFTSLVPYFCSLFDCEVEIDVQHPSAHACTRYNTSLSLSS
jgi:hypothetical protein